MHTKGNPTIRACILPLLLLSCVLCFALWAERFTQEQSRSWSILLAETRQSAVAQNAEETERRLLRAYHAWSLHQDLYHILMDHDRLDETEALFTEAMEAARRGKTDTVLLLLAQLEKQLQFLTESQALSLQNIV